MDTKCKEPAEKSKFSRNKISDDVKKFESLNYAKPIEGEANIGSRYLSKENTEMQKTKQLQNSMNQQSCMFHINFM